MPSVTKTVSILASEHLQNILNTRRGFMSVQYEFEKALKLIRPPVHLKVTDVFCSQFFWQTAVRSSPSSPTAERIHRMIFWHSKSSSSGNCFLLIPEGNCMSQQITATDSYRGYLSFYFCSVFTLLFVVSAGHHVSIYYWFLFHIHLPKKITHPLYHFKHCFLLKYSEACCISEN